ncbi:MAG: ECF transporter S component [Candidatus Zixiibacteriota bacterium]|nr:MAG: ECF transporter S component [candidate division Zixibacteria bacterium]
MIGGTRLIARIALFSALVYVGSWICAPIPNVNPLFFLVFSAGILWGPGPGILVGAVGMGLWTLFNPFGPATTPVMMAQVIGAAGSGIVGALYARTRVLLYDRRRATMMLVVAAVVCTYIYYVPVNIVDAWVFQPFWPRFVSGFIVSLVTLVSNLLIFPLLFLASRRLYERERAQL